MIIPALDIINGNIVRLYQGSYNMQTYYGNPMYYFKKYINQGAKTIHLVDLTGAKNPKKRQELLINKLIKEFGSLLNIQIGGGIRHTKEIEILLKLGVKRIVIGSIAITQPKIVKEWFNFFDPNVLVLSVDIRINSQGKNTIAIHGWEENTNIILEEIITEYSSIGLKHVLCTDISKDGTLSGSNISLYQSICHSWPKILFQASGGINSLTEITKLRYIGINSIIIGRAFLDEKFTISEAISCWQNE